MHYILGFDVKNLSGLIFFSMSGLLSSLQCVVSVITIMVFGLASDFCINRGFLTTRMTRIVCNSLATMGTAACIVIVSYTHNSSVAVFLLSLALGLFAGIHSGWMVNYIELSPNFSGPLMATGNTFSTIGIIFLPLLISNVVTDVFDRHQWRIVMFIIASILFVSNTFFVFFMSADPQLWDQTEEPKGAETKMTLMESKQVKEKK